MSDKEIEFIPLTGEATDLKKFCTESRVTMVKRTALPLWIFWPWRKELPPRCVRCLWGLKKRLEIAAGHARLCSFDYNKTSRITNWSPSLVSAIDVSDVIDWKVELLDEYEFEDNHSVRLHGKFLDEKDGE